jgi:hypothetical protein
MINRRRGKKAPADAFRVRVYTHACERLLKYQQSTDAALWAMKILLSQPPLSFAQINPPFLLYKPRSNLKNFWSPKNVLPSLLIYYQLSTLCDRTSSIRHYCDIVSRKCTRRIPAGSKKLPRNSSGILHRDVMSTAVCEIKTSERRAFNFFNSISSYTCW